MSHQRQAQYRLALPIACTQLPITVIVDAVSDLTWGDIVLNEQTLVGRQTVGNGNHLPVKCLLTFYEGSPTAFITLNNPRNYMNKKNYLQNDR